MAIYWFRPWASSSVELAVHHLGGQQQRHLPELGQPSPLVFFRRLVRFSQPLEQLFGRDIHDFNFIPAFRKAFGIVSVTFLPVSGFDLCPQFLDVLKVDGGDNEMPASLSS